MEVNNSFEIISISILWCMNFPYRCTHFWSSGIKTPSEMRGMEGRGEERRNEYVVAAQQILWFSSQMFQEFCLYQKCYRSDLTRLCHSNCGCCRPGLFKTKTYNICRFTSYFGVLVLTKSVAVIPQQCRKGNNPIQMKGYKSTFTRRNWLEKSS